jgi:hypothetical protein
MRLAGGKPRGPEVRRDRHATVKCCAEPVSASSSSPRSLPDRSSSSGDEPSIQAKAGSTERRRSRTYPAVGYTTSPVLKMNLLVSVLSGPLKDAEQPTLLTMAAVEEPLGPRRLDFGVLSDDDFELLCYLIVVVEFPAAVRLRAPDRGADSALTKGRSPSSSPTVALGRNDHRRPREPSGDGELRTRNAISVSQAA